MLSKWNVWLKQEWGDLNSTYTNTDWHAHSNDSLSSQWQMYFQKFPSSNEQQARHDRRLEKQSINIWFLKYFKSQHTDSVKSLLFFLMFCIWYVPQLALRGVTPFVQTADFNSILRHFRSPVMYSDKIRDYFQRLFLIKK